MCQCESLFKEYNTIMGGLDFFDQFASIYCVRIRFKKCRWPFFAWSINATVVNAWKLLCKIYGNNIPLLKLLHKLVPETPGKYRRNQTVQFLNSSEIVGTSIKLDTLNHVVLKSESKHCRFQQCGRRTIFKCKIYNVSLHPGCIKPCHQ